MLTVALDHPQLPRHPKITAQSGSHRSGTVDHDPEVLSEDRCHSIDFSRTTQNPGLPTMSDSNRIESARGLPGR
jgi:hypothetical protein